MTLGGHRGPCVTDRRADVMASRHTGNRPPDRYPPGWPITHTAEARSCMSPNAGTAASTVPFMFAFLERIRSVGGSLGS